MTDGAASSIGAPDEPSGTRLRVAVATSDPVAAWQSACVELLAEVDGVELVDWLTAPASRRPPKSGPRAAASPPDVLRALRRDGSGGGGPAPVEAHPPAFDVFLDLTLGAHVVPAARRWRFGYGAALVGDAERVALDEYAGGATSTRLALLEEPAGTILRDGRIQTRTWWRGALADDLVRDAIAWPAAAARDVLNGGSPAGGPVPRADPPAPARDVPERAPAALRAAAVRRRVAGTARSLVRQPNWNLGVVDAPIEAFLAGRPGATTHWLPARPGHFAADPFGIDVGDTTHILFEDFDQRRGIGSIWHVPLDPGGSFGEPRPVLDLGIHTSYPFLFADGGSFYLAPETSAAGRLVLFAAPAPDGPWTEARTLLERVPAVDATIVEFEGRWWLFATRVDYGDNHSLWIWHAPRPTGPWSEHEANPVKIDVASSRPAGTPFALGGILHRPAQDCSRVYGGRVVINRIEILTPRAFREVQVAAVEPPASGPYRFGTHTLSSVGSRTLIDGNARRFVPEAVPRTVAATMRRWRRP